MGGHAELLLDLRQECPHRRDDDFVHAILREPAGGRQGTDAFCRRRNQERHRAHRLRTALPEQLRAQSEEALGRRLGPGVALRSRAVVGRREHQLHQGAVVLRELSMSADVLREPTLEGARLPRGLEMAMQLVETVRGDRVEDGVPVTEMTERRTMADTDAARELPHRHRLLALLDQERAPRSHELLTQRPVVIGASLRCHLISVDVDNNVVTVYIRGMGDTRAGQAPTNETVIITGGTSGIGRATAVALAESGSRIILAVRNQEKGQAVAVTLPGTLGTHRVLPLDLARLETVRDFADCIDEPIAILVNNAGVESKDLQRTADGHELQFGTNHLGHFLLTTLLLPHITDRVVTVASQAERMARLDLDDLDWHRRPYQASRAYADSKLANLLFTSELDRRLRTSGSRVRALAAHPGLVKTAIYDRPAGQRPNLWDRLVPILGQEPEDGALPSLLAASADLRGGTFVGPRRMMHMRGGAEVISQSKQARNPETAARLWSISERMTAAGTRP